MHQQTHDQRTPPSGREVRKKTQTEAQKKPANPAERTRGRETNQCGHQHTRACAEMQRRKCANVLPISGKCNYKKVSDLKIPQNILVKADVFYVVTVVQTRDLFASFGKVKFETASEQTPITQAETDAKCNARNAERKHKHTEYTSNLSAKCENAHTPTTQAAQRAHPRASHTFLHKEMLPTPATDLRAPQNVTDPGKQRARQIKKQAPQMQTPAPKNAGASTQRKHNAGQRATAKN